jgi:hypothetical protein
MDSGEVSRMQEAVQDYYERFLDLKAFGQIFGEAGLNRVLVNAEEKSVPLVFPDKKFSRNI